MSEPPFGLNKMERSIDPVVMDEVTKKVRDLLAKVSISTTEQQMKMDIEEREENIRKAKTKYEEIKKIADKIMAKHISESASNYYSEFTQKISQQNEMKHGVMDNVYSADGKRRNYSKALYELAEKLRQEKKSDFNAQSDVISDDYISEFRRKKYTFKRKIDESESVSDDSSSPQKEEQAHNDSDRYNLWNFSIDEENRNAVGKQSDYFSEPGASKLYFGSDEDKSDLDEPEKEEDEESSDEDKSDLDESGKEEDEESSDEDQCLYDALQFMKNPEIPAFRFIAAKHYERRKEEIKKYLIEKYGAIPKKKKWRKLYAKQDPVDENAEIVKEFIESRNRMDEALRRKQTLSATNDSAEE